MALLNFMGQDRCDLSFASKEVSKSMSSPCENDQVPLKRIGRYLASYPRCVSLFRWQDPVAGIEVFSDSDWGGDQKTRKSTSGGTVMRGTHLVQHWSGTQQVVSLSSYSYELRGSNLRLERSRVLGVLLCVRNTPF